MRNTDEGEYVVLVGTEENDHWVVMAVRDPDCLDQARNLAEVYLAHLPEGVTVAVAQIISYGFKE